MRRVYGMKVVRITRGDLPLCTGRNAGAWGLETTYLMIGRSQQRPYEQAYSRQNGFYYLLAENEESGQYSYTIAAQAIASCFGYRFNDCFATQLVHVVCSLSGCISFSMHDFTCPFSQLSGIESAR